MRERRRVTFLVDEKEDGQCAVAQLDQVRFMAIIEAVGKQKTLAKPLRSIAGAKVLVLIGEVTISILGGNVPGRFIGVCHLGTNGHICFRVGSYRVDHIRQLVWLLNHDLKDSQCNKYYL